MSQFVKVPFNKFHKAVYFKKVVLSTIGNFPYTTLFKNPVTGEVLGKAVQTTPEGKNYPLSDVYYLAERYLKDAT